MDARPESRFARHRGADRTGVCISGCMPGQHDRSAAGQVHAQVRRNRPAPRTGREPTRGVHAIPDRVRRRRPDRRLPRSAVDRSRTARRARLVRPIQDGRATRLVDGCGDDRPCGRFGPARRPVSDLARLSRATGSATESLRESHMEIRPIISSLMRSKVAMILIGLQVALTLAIVCNALFIIAQRSELMNRPSGMNEADTFAFGSSGFGEGYDAKSVEVVDLALLRQLPGVADATTTNSVPMSGGGWGTGVSLQPKQKTETADTTLYFIDSHGLDTFGTKLVAGRDFKPEEIATMDQGNHVRPPTVIVTHALADKVFPEGNAVGKQIYLEEDPPSSTIVGIVDRLQEPWVDDKNIENAVLIPGYMPYGKFSRYLV